MLRTIISGISNFFSSTCQYENDYLDSENDTPSPSSNSATQQSVGVATSPSLHKPSVSSPSSSTSSVAHILVFKRPPPMAPSLQKLTARDASKSLAPPASARSASRRPSPINVTVEPGPSTNTRNCGVQADLISPGRPFTSLVVTRMKLGPPPDASPSSTTPIRAVTPGCGYLS